MRIASTATVYFKGNSNHPPEIPAHKKPFLNQAFQDKWAKGTLEECCYIHVMAQSPKERVCCKNGDYPNPASMETPAETQCASSPTVAATTAKKQNADSASKTSPEKSLKGFARAWQIVCNWVSGVFQFFKELIEGFTHDIAAIFSKGRTTSS